MSYPDTEKSRRLCSCCVGTLVESWTLLLSSGVWYLSSTLSNQKQLFHDGRQGQELPRLAKVYPKVEKARLALQLSLEASEKSINSKNLANFRSSRIVNDLRSLFRKPTAKTNQRVLRRSLNQIDLSRSHDGTHQSSALTDDESQDAPSSRNGTERTTRAVYAQKNVDHPVGDGGETCLYEVMRKELISAVQEIRTELEDVMVKTKHSDTT
ncbi:hypothetical protein MKX01_004856 [Papaver californicum]|nr:hypothetical protein MKX01_004856 [Papaver californicum]